MGLKRKKLTSAQKEIPLLEEVQKRKLDYEARRQDRFKRAYRIYLVTTLAAILLALSVVVGSVGKGASGFSGAWIESFAKAVVSIDFMNLSGNETPKEEKPSGIFDVLEDIFKPETDHKNPSDQGGSEESTDGTEDTRPTLTPDQLYFFDYNLVPSGETPIVPMDLSLSSYGASYIYNTTGLQPNVEALLQSDLGKYQNPEYLSASKASPVVLIVHTHGTESYSEDGAISYLDDGGELARSQDPAKTVVAVGKVLADRLNERGVPAVHCTVMHDQNQYKDSYARAEETIKQYLQKYPSIRLVIDLHRDSVVKSTGELVRPVTLIDGEAAAQVMCVVGSNWGGEENPNWEGNLALALKLREKLNASYGNLCRPVYLRSSTYNQELAPYSLLLEMGASGNSIEEAKRSAAAVADALVEFVPDLKK